MPLPGDVPEVLLSMVFFVVLSSSYQCHPFLRVLCSGWLCVGPSSGCPTVSIFLALGGSKCPHSSPPHCSGVSLASCCRSNYSPWLWDTDIQGSQKPLIHLARCGCFLLRGCLTVSEWQIFKGLLPPCLFMISSQVQGLQKPRPHHRKLFQAQSGDGAQ